MILIAEAGGTKIDWRSIDANGLISQYQTQGFNASTDNIARLTVSIKSLPIITPKKVYAYVAGLKSDTIKDDLMTAFTDIYQDVQHAEVRDDLIGAARGLYLEGQGGVGILGTGSAGFEYKSEKIINRIPSLGHLLGNEGSGYDLGKCFIKGLLRNEFSSKTLAHFKSQHRWFDEQEAIIRLNRDQNPSYLAQFSKSLFHYIDDPKVWSMVFDRLLNYLNVFFKESRPEIIRFSGSIAFYYQDLLLEACKELGFFCDRIIQSPIAGLTLYHQKYG
jgi:glucosamine kinase